MVLSENKFLKWYSSLHVSEILSSLLQFTLYAHISLLHNLFIALTQSHDTIFSGRNGEACSAISPHFLLSTGSRKLWGQGRRLTCFLLACCSASDCFNRLASSLKVHLCFSSAPASASPQIRPGNLCALQRHKDTAEGHKESNSLKNT